METAEEYIKRIHDNLKLHIDENPTGICSLFAYQVARRLKLEEREFEFVLFQDLIFEGKDDYHTRPMYPVLYNRKVGMGGHIVTCENLTAFDPLIGKPTPLDQYCKEAFGEELPSRCLSKRDKEFIFERGERMSKPNYFILPRFSFGAI